MVTLKKVKLNYTERAIKSLKMKISKYLYEKQSREWLPVLQDMTYSYNYTFHRSLKMTPFQPQQLPDDEQWAHLYLKDVPKRKARRP